MRGSLMRLLPPAYPGHCWETEFPGQRQRGRNGLGDLRIGGGHTLDVTAGSETINGSGQRSETCTDRTHATRPSGGNPHPAATSENDWKVAAFEY